MGFSSAYESKIPGPDGRIAYSAEEDAIWAELNQKPNVVSAQNIESEPKTCNM